jgi:hypothetical protein
VPEICWWFPFLGALESESAQQTTDSGFVFER